MDIFVNKSIKKTGPDKDRKEQTGMTGMKREGQGQKEPDMDRKGQKGWKETDRERQGQKGRDRDVQGRKETGTDR